MKRELEARLKVLKEEYHKGQGQLLALEQETANLRNTMIRISGAIQVLEELLAEKDPENSIPAHSSLDSDKSP